MKKFLTIGFALILISCNSIKQNASQSRPIQGNWNLVEFKNFTKEYLKEKEARMTLNSENQVSAYMGCNGKGLSYTISGNFTITFSKEITTTHRYCEDMKLEREFVKTISNMTNYKIEGNTLTLSDANQEKMVFETSN